MDKFGSSLTWWTILPGFTTHKWDVHEHQAWRRHLLSNFKQTHILTQHGAALHVCVICALLDHSKWPLLYLLHRHEPEDDECLYYAESHHNETSWRMWVPVLPESRQLRRRKRRASTWWNISVSVRLCGCSDSIYRHVRDNHELKVLLLVRYR